MSKVNFVLDEAAALGHLDAIDNAVGLGRGYGIRLQFYFQSIGQAKRCFPDGQEQTLLSNTSQVFFGVNDQQTAELVSNRLGETTIVVDSGGTSSGTNFSASNGHCPSTSSGFSNNRNANWQQQARKLLKPEEVTALSPRTAITFTPGMRPIYTTLVRYYERGFCPSWFGRLRADFIIFTHAALVCGFAVMVAVALTIAINKRPTLPVPARESYEQRSPYVESRGNGGSPVQRNPSVSAGRPQQPRPASRR